MYRVLLNFAGGINLAIGCLIFLVFLLFGADLSEALGFIPNIILLVTGGVFLYSANKRNLDKSFYKFVLISALCNLFTCNIF